MNKTLLLFLVCVVALTSGCAARVADLTLVSTKNIDLNDAEIDIRKGVRTKGEDCASMFLGFPLGQATLEGAVDDALEKGNGNVMVDQVTYQKVTPLILVTQTCIQVEGTVINASKR